MALCFVLTQNTLLYFRCSRRLLENVHLLRCTHPSLLQRTAQVRLIPQDFVRLAFKPFSTASKVLFRQVPRYEIKN